MNRMFGTLLCLGLAFGVTGCALCDGPFDETYSAYGGVLERQDRHSGRVGSILSDPAMQFQDSETREDPATEADIYYEIGQDAPHSADAM